MPMSPPLLPRRPHLMPRPVLGLAAFTAERRTKEIGISKVMGARTRDIVRLLAWQFSSPVLIANLIAWPVAWWVMRLAERFRDPDHIGPGPLPARLELLALSIALGLSSGTPSASPANPSTP